MEEAESKPIGKKKIIVISIIIILIGASFGAYIVLTDAPSEQEERIQWAVVNSTLPDILINNISTGPVFIGFDFEHHHYGDNGLPDALTCIDLDKLYGDQIRTIPIFVDYSGSAYLMEGVDLKSLSAIQVREDEGLFLSQMSGYYFSLFTKTNDTYYIYDGHNSENMFIEDVVDNALGIFNGTVTPILSYDFPWF